MTTKKWSELLTHEKLANDAMERRILYLIMKLIGLNVIVYVKERIEASSSIIIYEGNLYSGTVADGGLNVMLRNAWKRTNLNQPEKITHETTIVPQLMIRGTDVMRIDVAQADMSFGSDTPISRMSIQRVGQFKTDTEISSRIEFGRPRELQRWSFDDFNASDLEELENYQVGDAEWDQFAVNEARFGIKASFKEDMYTTPLNRDSEEYKIRLAAAEKIAQEIENTVAIDPHLAEERGQPNSYSVDDEEKLYSSVMRDQKNEKYPPFAKHNLSTQQVTELASSLSKSLEVKSENTSTTERAVMSIQPPSSKLNPFAAEFVPGLAVKEDAYYTSGFLTKSRKMRELNKDPLAFYASKLASSRTTAAPKLFVVSDWPSVTGSYKIVSNAIPASARINNQMLQESHFSFVQPTVYNGQTIQLAGYDFNSYSDFPIATGMMPPFASSNNNNSKS
jgi:hypothetical protein